MVLRSLKRSNSNKAGAGRPNELYNEFQFIVSVHVGTLTVLFGLQREKISRVPPAQLETQKSCRTQPGGDQNQNLHCRDASVTPQNTC